MQLHVFENEFLKINHKKKNYNTIHLQNILGVLKSDFWGFECPNDTQMPCWLLQL